MTVATPIISTIKISDMAKTQQPPQKVNFRISEVTVGEEVNEYGKVQVNLYFDVELGGKAITINKRLGIKPDAFTAEYATYIKGLMKQNATATKDGLDKESKKELIGADGWRDLWAYTFDIEKILLPLFRLAKLETPEFHQLVGVQGNASVGRDQKDFLTVQQVNGKVK